MHPPPRVLPRPTFSLVPLWSLWGIARVVHTDAIDGLGAKILILDEPTSALGVKEAEIVLRYVRRAKERGIGIIFITHNIHHAFYIGDTFEILQRGNVSMTFEKAQLTKADLLMHMAGGTELEGLAESLAGSA